MTGLPASIFTFLKAFNHTLGRMIFSKCKSDHSHSFDQNLCTSHNQLHGLQGTRGPDCCPLAVLISYKVLRHSLHPRHTDHIALSQKCQSSSHHDLCTCHSFCLECSSLRSLVSCRLLLNSQLSLPLSKITPYSLPPITVYCLFLFSFFLGCFLLADILLQGYSCLHLSFPSNVSSMRART